MLLPNVLFYKFDFPIVYVDKSEDEKKQDLASATMIPYKPIEMSFWSKFWELQVGHIRF